MKDLNEDQIRAIILKNRKFILSVLMSKIEYKAYTSIKKKGATILELKERNGGSVSGTSAILGRLVKKGWIKRKETKKTAPKTGPATKTHTIVRFKK